MLILFISIVGAAIVRFSSTPTLAPTETGKEQKPAEAHALPTEKPIPAPTPAVSKPISCPPKTNSEEQTACIALYKPVCAEVQVQCVRAPCPPRPHTFGNSCEACANPLVKEYTEGECIKK